MREEASPIATSITKLLMIRIYARVLLRLMTTTFDACTRGASGSQALKANRRPHPNTQQAVKAPPCPCATNRNAARGIPSQRVIPLDAKGYVRAAAQARQGPQAPEPGRRQAAAEPPLIVRDVRDSGPRQVKRRRAAISRRPGPGRTLAPDTGRRPGRHGNQEGGAPAEGHGAEGGASQKHAHILIQHGEREVKVGGFRRCPGPRCAANTGRRGSAPHSPRKGKDAGRRPGQPAAP